MPLQYFGMEPAFSTLNNKYSPSIKIQFIPDMLETDFPPPKPPPLPPLHSIYFKFHEANDSENDLKSKERKMIKQRFSFLQNQEESL